MSAALRSSLRLAGILLAFALPFTGLLATARYLTLPAIEASLAAERLAFLNEVLPRHYYDNDLLADTLVLPPTPELGQSTESLVYRARKDGRPAVLALEAIAPDGYAGKIRLILGITHDGTITGVRVIEHRETPGLGDYIDLKKDRNRQHPWILQFDGMNYPLVPDSQWKTQKENGHFHYRAGATLSPRAVIAAVHRAVRFAVLNRDALFGEEAAP
ncbi:MAG: electron transport complex subunit RsxG [Zoogloeaceae bacterium]|jgi:electron transport complex protein RnfG|nr:electron transport complex subunit RsxG [Zoogloeaceae bacterium]